MECLTAAGADLIAFETIPSIKEAQAVVELLREFPDSNAWLSFSCKVTTGNRKSVKLLSVHFKFPTLKRRLCFLPPRPHKKKKKHLQDEKHISDGSPFKDAVQIAYRSPQLLAVGVNCCRPAVVEPLLDSAREALGPDISWVVYPNSGEEWDTAQG